MSHPDVFIWCIGGLFGVFTYFCNMKRTLLLFLFLATVLGMKAEDGHALWLRYPEAHATVKASAFNETEKIILDELRHHWQGGPLTLDLQLQHVQRRGHVVVSRDDDDSFTIHGDTLTAHTDRGLLYAAYALLRDQALHGPRRVTMTSKPAYRWRLLNHWDNLDGTIERGYAGRSIFWNTGLARKAYDQRLREYARANASVGINAVVLNNVNASPRMLTKVYIDSVAHIAKVLRPYGIRVLLSVNFGSPKALGATSTADPLDPAVIQWWKRTVSYLYNKVYDFGGFCVKANSEGQPGPFDYGRSHADGANMLARALKPHGGLVFWRSFVYGSRHKGEDRVMQAVSEFKDQDGLFEDNVILQSKNGPLDFQPREPYAPIFDNISKTKQAVELQVTQEYTGQSRHLVYLAPMWAEFFRFVEPERLTAIAGVANIGDDANWCGHPFSQANWYAFARMAWDPTLTPEQIAREWIAQTFTPDTAFVRPVLDMMLTSREACVNYMTPLGLHHIMAFDHHYGPEPEGYKAEYPIEWCPVYYHKADSVGLGFDRSTTGTGATLQYREPWRSIYNKVETCPREYLLWFHHVAWDYRFLDGTTLWQQLCQHYDAGVTTVDGYVQTWQTLRGRIDDDRWTHVDRLLHEQATNAREWRDRCLGYFAQFRK